MRPIQACREKIVFALCWLVRSKTNNNNHNNIRHTDTNTHSKIHDHWHSHTYSTNLRSYSKLDATECNERHLLFRWLPYSSKYDGRQIKWHDNAFASYNLLLTQCRVCAQKDCHSHRVQRVTINKPTNKIPKHIFISTKEKNVGKMNPLSFTIAQVLLCVIHVTHNNRKWVKEKLILHDAEKMSLL